MKRFLGVDYGATRVGLATASDESKLASPLRTIKPHELMATIAAEGPFDVVVVGLPRSLDGRETPQTIAVRRFTEDVLGGLGAEMVFQDEAGTSSLAEERLVASGRKFDKAQIDAEAAAIILQDYVDSL